MARKKKKSKIDKLRRHKGEKLNAGQIKHRSKTAEVSALPPRTSGFNKETGVQTSTATKLSETNNEVTYQWTEDSGGDKVKLKRRMYKKDHATPMTEEDWVSINGSACKINKNKFNPNYDEIFGKRDRGAATGKFKKTKKTYK